MEFATPLRSLLDISNQTPKGFSADDRLEQAKLFYCTLKDIIQSDIDIRNKVQLVLYDGEYTSYISIVTWVHGQGLTHYGRHSGEM